MVIDGSPVLRKRQIKEIAKPIPNLIGVVFLGSLSISRIKLNRTPIVENFSKACSKTM